MYISYSVTAAECKDRWVKVRDNHRKALQRRRTKSGQAATNSKPPKFEKELSFLVPYLVDDAQRQSNFTPACTQITSQSQDDSNDLVDGDEETDDLHGPAAPTGASSGDLHPTTVYSPPPISAYSSSSASSSTYYKTNTNPKKRFRNAPPDISAANVLQEYLATKQHSPSTTNQIEDPLTSFFMCIANTVKGFPARDQIEMKRKIFQLVSDREMDIAVRVHEVNIPEHSQILSSHGYCPTLPQHAGTVAPQCTAAVTNIGTDVCSSETHENVQENFNILLSLANINRTNSQ